MKPPEFIRFAEKLAVQPSPVPAALRSAASRAYYGAYHLTLEFIESLGFSPGYNHDLPRWLANCPLLAARKLGQKLADLQSNRVKADYRLAQLDTESPSFARQSVELATDFERLLKECQPADAPAEIAAHIKAFLAKRIEH